MIAAASNILTDGRTLATNIMTVIYYRNVRVALRGPYTSQFCLKLIGKKLLIHVGMLFSKNLIHLSIYKNRQFQI